MVNNILNDQPQENARQGLINPGLLPLRRGFNQSPVSETTVQSVFDPYKFVPIRAIRGWIFGLRHF